MRPNSVSGTNRRDNEGAGSSQNRCGSPEALVDYSDMLPGTVPVERSFSGQSRGGPACLCSALAAYSLAVLGVLAGFIVVRSDGEGEHTICSAPSGLRITPVLGLPPKSSSRRAGTVLALCLSTYNRAAVYGLALGSDSF